MNRIIQFRYFFPLYIRLIALCHKVKFYGPIIFLSSFFIDEIKPQSKATKAGAAFLALRPTRFGDDLQQIADQSAVRVYTLSFDWQCCLIAAFYKKSISFETLFTEDKTLDDERLKAFFAIFLPLLYKRYQIKGVLSAAVHYYTDYLWGSHTHLLGYLYIIMHRECFHASENRRLHWLNIWSQARAFEASYIIVHNEHVRATYIESGIITPEQIKSLGCIRMDEFIKDVYPVKEEAPLDTSNKKAVLFSFPHGVGMVGVAPLWSKKGEFGFIELFKETHAAFGKFAQRNKDVECIIKLKWCGGGWEDNIIQCLQEAGINYHDLPNLRITDQDCPQELIKTASVVSSFNSTVLLEASLARKPLLIPYMEEATKNEYSAYIHLFKNYELFSLASSQQDYIDKLEDMILNPGVSDARYKELCELFAEWISPLQANALLAYCNELENLLKTATKEPQNE